MRWLPSKCDYSPFRRNFSAALSNEALVAIYTDTRDHYTAPLEWNNVTAKNIRSVPPSTIIIIIIELITASMCRAFVADPSAFVQVVAQTEETDGDKKEEVEEKKEEEEEEESDDDMGFGLFD